MSAAAYQSTRWRGVLAILLAGLLLGGCSRLADGATIDGWQIGPVQPCPVPNLPPGVPFPEHPDCARGRSDYETAGTAALAKRDPGHAAILRMTLHEYAGTAVFTSVVNVAVFELADGSVRAIGLVHPGVDTEHLFAIDYGP